MIESNWKYIAQRSGLSSSKLYLMKNTCFLGFFLFCSPFMHVFEIERMMHICPTLYNIYYHIIQVRVNNAFSMCVLRYLPV